MSVKEKLSRNQRRIIPSRQGMKKVIIRFAAKGGDGRYIESNQKFEFWGVPYFTGDVIELLNYDPELYPQHMPFKFYPKTGDRFRISAYMTTRLGCIGGQEYDEAVKDPKNFDAELSIRSGNWNFRDNQVMLYRRPLKNWFKLLFFNITKRHKG